MEKAKSKGIAYSAFYEPDLGHALTALVLAPGDESKRLCSSFPLALKQHHDNEDRMRGLIHTMRDCEQTSGMNMLEHGEMVRDAYRELMGNIRWLKKLPDWRLPDWLEPNRSLILGHLLPDFIAEKYAIFHDCGKPFCRTEDEDGRSHFPDHAKKSEEIWRSIMDENSANDEQIAKLIGMDMDIHLLKSEGLEEFASRKEAITLLLMGLAEIHANAKMFGGIESTSFKIKWKQIDRRGKQIIDLIKSR